MTYRRPLRSHPDLRVYTQQRRHQRREGRMTEGPGRAPRTLLEAIIHDRCQTFEEFSEDAEQFGREHGETGTLSVRHVQRLAAGSRADGRPLGAVRPATRRLLERMLGYPIQDLLSPPPSTAANDVATQAQELAANLATAKAADPETISAFRQRLDLTRTLDRRFGAEHLLAQLSEQVIHMQKLCRYSVNARARQSLAALIVDSCALAGWQCLDRADPAHAWDYYSQGLTAAAESESTALRSYVAAAQSVVLLDLGDHPAALAMAEHARKSATGRMPLILAAWLAAAHGESYAANKQPSASLRAFDDAERLLCGALPEEAPFLVFGHIHLKRWRGSALTRLGHSGAIDVLTNALNALPPNFARAETALNTDLAYAYESAGEREAAESHAIRAERLACQIGSARHRQRIARLRQRKLLSRVPDGSSAIRR
jgi:hypothetical protein